jgi:hypothetical protein
MPYELKAFYKTVPSDPDTYCGTGITLEDVGTDDESIVVCYTGEDAPPDRVAIATEEWPLIVEAVEKLLASRRQSTTVGTEPVVTEGFLESIAFIRDNAREVLEGCHNSLFKSFRWSSTNQGNNYWYKRATGRTEFSDDDKALIKSWVDAANYYEKNND